ncbi:exportin-4 protein isoform X2 [Tasmannia lanceolata]|uniref:exportin-4 protein isoform X2 n=1 Tax=Tasmannia lanceolata TaxID=3420 RepID=UPI00406428A1
MQRVLEGGTDDLSHLQSTMYSIEQACSSIQMHMNPGAAEATILALCQSPQPYRSCQFILENSQLPNARFQAAAAIRDAAIREWGFLTSEDKGSLIRFCLCFVMEHSNSPDGYVQAKVSAVGAQLLKRGWLDFNATEREAFISQVKHAVLGSYGLDSRFTGINFLESLVSEFSPSTSTAMGLPTEFLEQCRASLELDYMKSFYCWAQDAALNVADKILDCSATLSEDKVCSAALRLMFQILNWDFQYTTSGVEGTKNRRNLIVPGVRRDTSLLKKCECILVQPGPSWRDILISSGHIGWLLGFYGTLRQKFSCDGSWFDSPLAVSARQLIVHLFSLSGAIFPSDDGQMQEKHLLQMLSGVIQWIDPPAAILNAIRCGKSESELFAGCLALLSIATLVTPVVFDKLLKSISPFGTVNFLSALTCEVVKANTSNDNEDETWTSDALDTLLDTWNVLLEPTDLGKNTLSPEGISAAAAVFNVIMEYELKAAAKSAFEDDDDSDHFYASISARDERLSSYALIARSAADVTIPLLTKLFSERLALLYQGKGTSDPTCTLEELYWILLIAGHVLADKAEGETPLVPEALQAQFMDVVEATQHPIVILSGSIITFTEQSLDPDMRQAFFSPRLMEAVVWFLSRWADTYLMPLETRRGHNCTPAHEDEQLLKSHLHRKALLNFCGEHNQGKRVLDIIVRISTTTLISYAGENDLQALTCYQLLPSLVRRRNVCAHLVALVSCLLERLRGAARSTQPRTQKAIFDIGLAVMNPLLTLLEIYKNQSAVVYMILKFVVDWVDGQVMFLEAKDTAVLVSFCMRLLEIYSSHNIGKISLSISSSLLSEAKTEKYKDLRALLQLLTNLCSKDLVDFSSGSDEGENTDISQVVYLGLHIITPLISLDLLKYPKLCRDYFALLSHLLEVYPEKVARLNAEAFAHIVGTLDFGIRHQDTEVVNVCLSALNALASYHYKERSIGKEGLGAHAEGFEDPNGKLQEGILSRFLQSLLHLLLFEDYSTELVDSTADALLPLILCEQGLYQRLGQELLEKQANPVFQSRLAVALQTLTSSNQLSSSLDRPNYKKFRKNLHNFLIEVRGFLRTI